MAEYFRLMVHFQGALLIAVTRGPRLTEAKHLGQHTHKKKYIILTVLSVTAQWH